MNSEFIFYTKSTHSTAYKVHAHTHPCYELVYYLEGEGITRINDLEIPFRPNSFALYKPNELHDERSNDCVKLCYIGFNCTELELQSGLYDDADQIVFRLLEEIDKEMTERQYYYQHVLNILTERLAFTVLRMSWSFQHTESNFDYIKNYIRMNANKNVTIRELAFDLNYNYDYLRQLFLSKMNISAKNFFIEEKLKNVKDYLSNSNYTVKQIASITGFASSSHLCSVFKKYLGVSPVDFRKAQKQNTFTDNKPSFV